MRVFLEPGGESVICFGIWEASYYHFGRFSGVESILICCCLTKLAVDMVGLCYRFVAPPFIMARPAA